MKKIILFLIFIKSLSSFSQKQPSDFYSNNLLKLEKQFWDNKMKWPPKRILIRVFKYEKNLEIWVTDSVKYIFFKNYKICMLSGGFGPKRSEGDLQVPEGFYYINDFNYHSKYHLSLGINYPNISDRILSNSKNLGGSIYIHGDCVSIGCLSMGNINIEEIFTITKFMYSNGQTYIPIHIFPVNYYNLKSLKYFDDNIFIKKNLMDFEKNIFDGFYFFDETNELPIINVDENGNYIFN